MNEISKQDIKDIKIIDLAFWKDNPRDIIPGDFTDTQIANRAIHKKESSKWGLEKLFEMMKAKKRYNLSELPTVVYEYNIPVVYDGNKRVLIGKLIHNYIKIENCPDFSKFEFPQTIPCNVCDRQTALEYVYINNIQSKSWGQIERDIFAHKYLDKNQTLWLTLDNATHIISNNPKLNQRFVRDEIFKEPTLRRMGFSVSGGVLMSCHNTSHEAEIVLKTVVDLISNDLINTRKNRGKIIELLESDLMTMRIIKAIENQTEPKWRPFHTLQDGSLRFEDSLNIERKRKTPIKQSEPNKIFGGPLALKTGSVNNLYRDIENIHTLLNQKKINTNSGSIEFSDDCKRIIRMSLRLICDVAAQEAASKLSDASRKKSVKNQTLVTWYVNKHSPNARTKLTKRERELLSSYNLNEKNVLELLHGGAHGNYTSTLMEQTIMLSIIIGKILEESHGKK